MNRDIKRSVRDKEIYNFIIEYINQNGYSPTIREICTALDISTTSTVYYSLSRLEENGLISKQTGSKRAILVNGIKNAILVPILGTITAGQPIEAIEQNDGFIHFNANGVNKNDLFALRISGTSMINAGILDGDIAIIEKTPYVDNGVIAAVMIDGEATIKRFYKEEGGKYRLKPENDNMHSIITDHCEILGKVIGIERIYE